MKLPFSDLSKAERIRLLYVTLGFMCVTSAALVGRTVGDTLFLSHFHIDNLSYMYVGTAFVVCTVSIVYSIFAGSQPITRLIGFSSIIFIGLLIILRIALDSPWAGFRVAAYFMGDLVVNVPIMLFWSFAALLFNPRDAKRVFGFIGAGGTFACIVTGAIIKPFTVYWGTANLLLLVAGYLLIFLFSIWRASKQHTPDAPASPPAGQKGTTSNYYRQLIKTSQIRNLVLLVVSATCALTIVDYQFKAGARTNYSPDQLAGFFGDFYSRASLIALFIQLFLVHRLLQKGGVLLGLCLLPAALGLGALATLATAQFAWIVTAKFAVQILLFTIDIAALQMLYLGIPIQSRSQARAFVDGIAKPLAMAITGLILIGASQVLDLHLLAWGAVLGCVAWLWLSRANYKSYVSALMDSLGSRRFDFSQETSGLNDKTLETRIRQSLREATDDELIYLVGMVSDLDEVDWTPEFRALIQHNSPEVKIAALAYLQNHGNESDVADIVSLLGHHDDGVRAAAITTLATLGGQEIIPKIEPALVDPVPTVRASAIAAMIDSGDLDYLIDAGIVLKNLLHSDKVAERIAAAKALENIGSAALVKPIVGLLQDDAPMVQLAALEICKTHIDPRLVPVVITLLANPSTASKTAAILPSFGASTLEHLIPYLELREAEGAFEGAHHVPKIMADIGDRAAMPVLEKAAGTKDLALRHKVLKAYCTLAQTAPTLKPYMDQFIKLIQIESTCAQQRINQLYTFSNTPGNDLLIGALEEAKSSHIYNTFLLLDTCHPDVDLLQILKGLTNPSGADKANALEVLDNVLPKNIKPAIIALFDPQEQLIKSPLSAKDLLPLFSPAESRWIITGGLMVYIDNQSLITDETLTPLLQHKDPVVRETTLFALNVAGNMQSLQDYAYRLENDADPSVRNLALSLFK